MSPRQVECFLDREPAASLRGAGDLVGGERLSCAVDELASRRRRPSASATSTIARSSLSKRIACSRRSPLPPDSAMFVCSQSWRICARSSGR